MKKIVLILVFISSFITAQQKEFKYSLNGITKVVLTSDTKMIVEVGNTSQLIITDTKNNKSKSDERHEHHEDHFPNKKSKEKEDKRK